MQKPNKKLTPKDLERQITDLTEALQRERADSENIRRRHEDQISSIREHVKANVVRDLLPVIDNFERALKHIPKEFEGSEYIKGIQGVVKQFEDTLTQMGVERIKTVGEVFDPTYHEAVSMEEGDPSVDGQNLVEVICEELQSGYKLGDQVIRHAMVKVKMEAKQ